MNAGSVFFECIAMHHKCVSKEQEERTLQPKSCKKELVLPPQESGMGESKSAFCAAVRETAFLLLLISSVQLPVETLALIMAIVCCGFIVWRAGLAALFGYQSLDQLHEIMEQQKWEIDHHREHEREELKNLYREKGFSEPLLDEVVDVLMADGDRLLAVKLEEELGLSLEKKDHPLQKATAAATGVLVAGLFCIAAVLFFPFYAMPAVPLLLTAAVAFFLAKKQQIDLIAAVVWNTGLMMFCWTLVSLLIKAWV